MIKVQDIKVEYRKNPIGIDCERPEISWKIISDQRNTYQTAYRIRISMEKKGLNDLAGDTGKVELSESVNIPVDFIQLMPETRYYISVKVWDNHGNESDFSSESESDAGEVFWETGLMGNTWAAKWISAPWHRDNEKNKEAFRNEFKSNIGTEKAYDMLKRPADMFRKDFSINKKIKCARVYATSLGLYELSINGRKVGDELFTPGWTSYNKRLQYQTYDVTDMLQSGENVIAGLLGVGWYSGNIAWEKAVYNFGTRTALLVQMQITYDDGTKNMIVSDRSWKVDKSPILMSEIYHGEIYDARLEQKGWDSDPDFNASGFSSVDEVENGYDHIVSQENVPTRAIQEIKPIALIKTPEGDTVIDMGQNMTGMLKFKVSGNEGDEVVLKHFEILDKDGNAYFENLRAALQTVRYTLKGKEKAGDKETFVSHFSFYGFRYVKVEKFPGDISLDDFTGIVIHSDMEDTGDFECSNSLINQLQHNIKWGQKGNFLEVPTDCPQRDERLGWTGDAQMFIRTASYLTDHVAFFRKWLKDLKADQAPDGRLPVVVPDVIGEHDFAWVGSAAWGDASIICPWTLYLCFGDKRVLEEQYGSMKAWLEYIHHFGDKEFLWNGDIHFGDWVGLDAKEGSYEGATDKDYIASAFFAYSTGLVAKIAKILGKEQDVKYYDELYSNIKAEFNREFFTPNGRISIDTQTGCIVALMFDLIEGEAKDRTIKRLVKMVKDNNIHLTTGFVGTPYLCHVLSMNGHHDLACELLLKEDYPSWLYQITKGATTIWEHWDGIKPDGSLWSKDMNSFNHYAYGSVGDWMYQWLAGIEADESAPGYKHFFIKPLFGAGLTYVKADYKSVYGNIAVHIVRTEMDRTGEKPECSENNGDRKTKIKISVPANTTADIILPEVGNENDVKESGKNIFIEETGKMAIEGIHKGVFDGEAHSFTLTVGSGEYEFSY